MGWRGTTVMALLIALTATVLWFTAPAPRQEPETPLGPAQRNAPPTRTRPLLDFDPGEVVRVELVDDGRTLETQRTDSGWQGVERSDAIDDFLRNLAAIGVVLDLPVSESDLQDYGLATPRKVIRLSIRGRPQPLVLHLGDRNPATTGVYVRIGDNGPVVLAGALVAWEFDKARQVLAAGRD